ncbi:ATP-binding protein [Aliarcobacter skirrowii]|uniref:ATP-binding protein n=1 Tax=Aliarcobacter skirrowii TaxID=28200 RepID=UPI003207DBDF
MKKLKINLTNQELLNASNVPGINAIKEAVWNSFDAEAEKIEINLLKQDLGAVEVIAIEDNGHGISFENFKAEFSAYGKSNKAGKLVSPDKKRFYHGKEGKGRFRLFAIGNSLEWETTYYDKDIDKNLTYKISIEKDAIDDFKYTDPEETNKRTGTKIVIRELNDIKLKELLKKNIEFELIREMSPTLKAYYDDLEIYLDNEKVDYKKFLYAEETNRINIELNDEKSLDIEYDFLVWKEQSFHDLFLCDNNSKSPLSKDNSGTRSTIVSHSCFLYSEYFVELFHHDGLDDMNGELKIIKTKIKRTLDELAWKYHRKMIEDKVVQVKEADIYPYDTEPKDNYEILERAVFDSALAMVINKYPGFDKMAKSAQKLNLKLLKTVIEQGENIENTLENILNLSSNEHKELSMILEKTSFQSIIRKYKIVVHYLSFLKFLEEITYKDTIVKHLKERLGLQKIIRDELWIFGDEYSLIGDDDSIKTVIKEEILKVRKSKAPIFDFTKEELDKINEELQNNPDEYSKHIPDLFLIRKDSQRNQALVIELKAPKVDLDFSHTKQIVRYAEKISTILNQSQAQQDRLELNFILISSGIKDEISGLIDENGNFIDRNLPANVKIKIHNWASLLQKRAKELDKVKKDLDLTLNGEEYQAFFEKYKEPLAK